MLQFELPDLVSKVRSEATSKQSDGATETPTGNNHEGKNSSVSYTLRIAREGNAGK
jgi:hypothetical protein